MEVRKDVQLLRDAQNRERYFKVSVEGRKKDGSCSLFLIAAEEVLLNAQERSPPRIKTGRE